MLVYSESNINAEAAQKQIKEYVRNTPVEECYELSKITHGQIFFKMECWQKTGSFKIRGALNRILSLTDDEKKSGVITASAGNHGLGVAYASNMLGIRSRIVLPVNASAAKVRMLNHYGTEVIQAGRDYDESEDVAHRIEQDCGLTFVHAFEDPDIISGQGTISLEILEELPEVDTILVPVGGGGLVTGIAITAKQIKPDIKIIGVQSEASPAMFRALKANRAVETPIGPTVADGLAGRLVSPNILPSVAHYVDDFILVSEDDIIRAITFFLKNSRNFVEGAAAVGIAALLGEKVDVANKKCVAILTGRNADLESLLSILCIKLGKPSK
ncbi:hypothetical protein B6I21_05035 [candidate division KSB1 bacterium 4572_119]|nr:MAG: hypothetical protein B6I21_05035 [candidate division KSB1 bacterium 4572_119]